MRERYRNKEIKRDTETKRGGDRDTQRDTDKQRQRGHGDRQRPAAEDYVIWKDTNRLSR